MRRGLVHWTVIFGPRKSEAVVGLGLAMDTEVIANSVQLPQMTGSNTFASRTLVTCPATIDTC